MTYSKPCKKCGQVKNFSEFHRNTNIADGHKNSCKSCESLIYKQYRLAKPRVLTESQKQKDKERRKKHSQTPKFKAARANWYQNNKDRVREQTRSYRSSKPGLNAFYVRRYRARQKGNGVFAISHKEIEKLRLGSCFYCGNSKSKMTLDHVIPINRGGRHSIGNLVSACQSCNSSKADRFITEWKKAKGRLNATN